MSRFLFLIFIVVLLLAVIERFLNTMQKGESVNIKSFIQSFHQGGKSIWQGLQLFVVIWVIYLIVSLWFRNRN